jgi:hypothetical protein
MGSSGVLVCSVAVELYVATPMKKECPNCAMNVSEEVVECPICGYEFPERPRWVIWLAVFLLLIILWLWVFR